MNEWMNDWKLIDKTSVLRRGKFHRKSLLFLSGLCSTNTFNFLYCPNITWTSNNIACLFILASKLLSSVIKNMQVHQLLTLQTYLVKFQLDSKHCPAILQFRKLFGFFCCFVFTFSTEDILNNPTLFKYPNLSPPLTFSRWPCLFHQGKNRNQTLLLR